MLTNPFPPNKLHRILFIIFLLSLPLVNPIVHGDGVGYYAYARAPLIEHNLDFTQDYRHANESFRDARLDAQGNVQPEFFTRTRHLDNHFTVGPAMLWAPFLLLAHGGVLLVRALGSSVPADGFSLPYRYAMAFGTAVYGFLGLLLAFSLAKKYLGERWALLATIGIWWGSSLPVYMYFNPSWSHAQSAFVVALFLWYWDATREGRSLRAWLVLGLIVGLMLDVYYANLMIVSVLAVEAIAQYVQIFKKRQTASTTLGQLVGRHLVFGLVVCLTMLPTFISRQIVYGGPFETGYVSLRDFLWRSPVLLTVLFSANHGLLSWTPILALSIVGVFLFARIFPPVGIPFLSALLAFYLFIAFYPDWAGISSFGNRFFLSLTPLFVLGLACVLEKWGRRFTSPRLGLAVVSGVLACLVIWNLGLIYQWGAHMIPSRGAISFREAAHNQFYVVPQKLSGHLRSYLLHRNELMQQIEQKDLEQLKQNSKP